MELVAVAEKVAVVDLVPRQLKLLFFLSKEQYLPLDLHLCLRQHDEWAGLPLGSGFALGMDWQTTKVLL